MVATKPRPFPGTSQRTAPLRGSMFPIFLKIRFSFVPFFCSNLHAIQTKYRLQFFTNRFGAIILPSFIFAEHVTNQVCSFEFLFSQLNKIQFSSIVFGEREILAYFGQFGLLSCCNFLHFLVSSYRPK